PLEHKRVLLVVGRHARPYPLQRLKVGAVVQAGQDELDADIRGHAACFPRYVRLSGSKSKPSSLARSTTICATSRPAFFARPSTALICSGVLMPGRFSANQSASVTSS